MFRESTADFTGIPRNVTDAPNLFVSEVIQQAFISVDEEGTEAAAASGIFPITVDLEISRFFFVRKVANSNALL